jgi:hypothetical protein
MGPAIKAAAVVGLMVLAALPAARAEDYPVGTRDSIWSDPGTYMIGSFRHMARSIPRGRCIGRARSASCRRARRSRSRAMTSRGPTCWYVGISTAYRGMVYRALALGTQGALIAQNFG